MEMVLVENINMASPAQPGGDGNTLTMNHPSHFITLSDHEQVFPGNPNILILIFNNFVLSSSAY